MSSLVRRLQVFPWKELVRVSALSLVLFVIVDILLQVGQAYSPVTQRVINFILSMPVLTLLLNQSGGLGLGALSVAVLERFYRNVYITAGSLWALFACLLLGLLIVYSLPVPGLIIGLGQIPLLGLVVGIFWKGRSHCRWSSGCRKF
jgi:hypothetical protein